MRILAFLAALTSLAAAAPASVQQWWMFHQKRERGGAEAAYADLGSIVRSGRVLRIELRAFGSPPPPIGAASVALRIELDCGRRQARPLDARALDADGRQIGDVQTGDAPFRPIETVAIEALARLVCDGQRAGFQAVPNGASLDTHAASLLASLMPPTLPEPPVPTAEERAAFERMTRERREQRFEGVIRRALAQRCGEELHCRGFESRIERGVEPVVALADVECTETVRGTFGRASCRFSVRHPRTRRSVSCTVELAESVGEHSRYWSALRIRPAPPQPPPAGVQVPDFPAYDSSLICSGSLIELVSEQGGG